MSKRIVVFLTVIGFLSACSHVHRELVTTQVRFGNGSDVFESEGAADSELFSSLQPLVVCATVQNTSRSSIRLRLASEGSEQAPGEGGKTVSPGEAAFVCGETSGITAVCEGPECSYRWSLTTPPDSGITDLRLPGGFCCDFVCERDPRPPAPPSDPNCGLGCRLFATSCPPDKHFFDCGARPSACTPAGDGQMQKCQCT